MDPSFYQNARVVSRKLTSVSFSNRGISLSKPSVSMNLDEIFEQEEVPEEGPPSPRRDRRYSQPTRRGRTRADGRPYETGFFNCKNYRFLAFWSQSTERNEHTKIGCFVLKTPVSHTKRKPECFRENPMKRSKQQKVSLANQYDSYMKNSKATNFIS